MTKERNMLIDSPFLLGEWNSHENGLPPESISLGSGESFSWKCSQGHTWMSSPANRARGRNCPYCGNKKVWAGFNDLATTHPQFVKEWHETNTLTPQEVTAGSTQKISWECEEGHIYVCEVYRRKAGRGCSVCAGKVVTPEVSLMILHPDIAATWHPTKNGKTTPNDVSIGSAKYYFWIGKDCGHEYKKMVKSRVKGENCPYCATSNTTLLPGFNDLETVFPDIAKEWHPTKNGDLTPSMVSSGSGKRFWWQCVNDHEWQVSVCNRTKTQTRCKTCAMTGTSRQEEALADFVKSIVGEENVIFNSRQVINPNELDIYIPSKNIAIEFNGLYWHSEAGMKDKHYHYNKWKDCFDQGIQLIQIWEDDWQQRENVIKSMLSHKLGVSRDSRVFARKLKVVSLKTDVVKSFLNTNHIQGFVGGSYYFGLVAKDCSDVVKLQDVHAVMVLSRRSDDVVELSRYATTGIVVGGFSKILKYVVNEVAFSELITFADLQVSDGNLYEMHGFTMDKLMSPDYSYFVNNERQHKFRYRLKRFKNDDALLWREGLTERELADLNQLVRIWDTGKIRYILRKSNGSQESVITTETNTVFTPQIRVQNELNARDGKEHSIKRSAERQASIAVLKEQYEKSDKNVLPFDKHSSQSIVWWVGTCNHEFQARITARLAGHNCPYCAGRQVLTGVNDFATHYPDLVQSFSPKNDFDISSVTRGSRKSALWECDKGHEWNSGFARRASSSCPVCSNKKVLIGFNDLATTHPELVEQWHKDNVITPQDLVAGSNVSVLWVCKKGHEWHNRVFKRALQGKGCPYCTNKKVLVGYNDLATTHPKVAANWSVNNELSPQEVVAGSAKRVLWSCSRGHEWTTTVNAMVNAKHACSTCRSRYEGD